MVEKSSNTVKTVSKVLIAGAVVWKIGKAFWKELNSSSNANAKANNSND